MCFIPSISPALQTSCCQVNHRLYRISIRQRQREDECCFPVSRGYACCPLRIPGLQQQLKAVPALSTVVAADWLGSFSLQDKVQLFHAFFAAAPAAMLLPTLVT